MSSGNHGSASKGKGLQHPDAYEGQIQGAAAVATEAGTTAADRVAPQLLAVPLCIGITRRGVRGCLEEYQQAAGPSDTQLSVKDSRRAQSPGPSAAPGSSGVTHGSGATSSQESRKEKEVTDCKQLLLPQPWCDALRVVHCHVPDASDVTIDSVICPVVSSQSPMPGLNKSTLGSASAAAVTRSAATSRYGSAATSTSAWMHNALAAVAASYDAYAWLLRHVHYYPGLTGGAA